MKKWTGVAMATAMIVLCSMTAYAADWNFYGSVRMATYYVQVDDPGGDKVGNYEQGLQTNSRIGAKVRSDNIRGRFEYGVGSDGETTIRILCGEYRFGSGSLKIGQDYAPFNMMGISNQVYREGDNQGNASLWPWGGTFDGREAMIQLKFGDFKIAAVEPVTDDLNVSASKASMETSIPKIEAKYRFNFDQGQLEVAALYNTYELTDTDTGIAYDVNSLLLSLGGEINFGAVTLAGSFWFGQNPGTSGIWNAPYDSARVEDDQLLDCDGYGFILVAAYQLNDMLRFETGYGYTAAEIDHEKYQKDDEASYYLQANITVADGISFIPEVGFVDEMLSRTGKEQNETFYCGMQWRIDF